MIDTELLNEALLTVAVLVGAAILLAVAVMAAGAAVSKPGHGPHGGIRRDPAPQPQPQPDADETGELVLR